MNRLPSGTVTFLFTDIEGSTKLLQELGDGYADALAKHRRILREAFKAHAGVEVDTQGDAFFYAFARASDAIAGAAAGRSALEDGPIRVRMGLHTGEPILTNEGYVGIDVHKAARICSAGHGGQILASEQCVSVVGPNVFVDLGVHRLKDLSQPEHIFQLGDGTFPPLKTLHLSNLPIQVTPFIGRETEVREVLSVLEGSGFRLLTLTGPGGIGKSRLALQCAAEISSDYPDGVWWVALSALRDPQLVAGELARAIGSSNGPVDHVGSKRMFIVFDNFEHMTEAASLLSDLLASCPNIGIMTTSREPLHLSAEREYPVPPLTDDEAVLLFRQHASSTTSEATTRSICRRLDRLPLAIELAAARTKALSVDQILERLDQRLPLLTGGPRDAPERQRTLRATIEWSFSLLAEAEQGLFARLAVFEGGFTLSAAESVCEANVDQLQSLVDKSLLHHAEERFFMLETIHEYARERLVESPDVENTRTRHLKFFIAFAEEASADLESGRRDTYWLNRLEPDHDNFRVAFGLARSRSDGDVELRLAIALFYLWMYHGPFTEGRRRLSEALALYDSASDTLRGPALLAAARLAWKQRDLQDSRARANEALSLFRTAGNKVGVGRCLISLGVVAYLERDLDEARRLDEEVIDLLEGSVEGKLARSDALHNLAMIEAEQGRYEEARGWFEQALVNHRKRGSDQRVANTLNDLGFVAIAQHRDAEARELLTEGLRLLRKLGWRENIQYSLIGLASIDARAGAFDRAVRLLGAVQALADEMLFGLDPYAIDLRANTEDELTSHLGKAEFERLFEEGRSESLDDSLDMALGDAPE